MIIRTLEIHGELPTLNEYIRAERGSRWAAAKMKKGWTDAFVVDALNPGVTVTIEEAE